MGEEDLLLRAAIRDELSGPLETIRGEVRGLGGDVETVGRRASWSSRGFHLMGRAAKIAAGVATAAFGAALAGGYALFRLGKSAYAEAMEAVKVGRTTTAIIKSTGASAWTSAKQVGALTTRMSEKIGVDDEAIQQGANLLLTFQKVRNEVGKGNRIFDRANKAAADMAAAGFGSLVSQSKVLGKALNDPVKGLSMLSRYGVTFTQSETDRITSLVEQNRLLDAQKLILDTVEGKVQGTAAAQATWTDKADVAWKNIEERLGKGLLPLIEDFGRWFVQTGGPVLDHWVGIFERRGIPAIREFASKALPKLKDGAQQAYDTLKPLAESLLPAAADVFDRIWTTVKWLAPKLKTVFDGFNGLPEWAKAAIVAGAGTAVVGQKLGVWKTLMTRSLGTGSTGGGLLGTVATRANPIPVWVVNDGFGDLPGGKPGSSPTVASTTSKVLKYGGVLAIEAAAVTLAAEKMGEWLGNRPWKMDGDPHYKENLPKIVEQMPETPVYTTFDPLTGLPTIKTNVLANGNRSIEEVQRAADLLRSLPAEVQTEIRLHGAPESRREANELAKTYDLTAAERTTLFRTSGIPLSQQQVSQLLHLYQSTPRDLTTTARFDSGLAELRIESYRSKLASIPGMTSAVAATPRANGGPVSRGQAYLVGEKRPELFVPNADGYIHPRVTPVADRPAGRGGQGTVVVERGAFQTTIHGVDAPNLDDLHEAWEQFLIDWLRDRNER